MPTNVALDLTVGPNSESGATTEQWSSRAGFVLASVGAAVGLGNIWRFSYVAGDNGGGAFLVVYLMSLLLVGAPILIAELALGRNARGDALQVFERLTRHRIWHVAGALGILGSSLIMSFYFVVAAAAGLFFE